jgi:hypothetical protein
MSIKCISLPTSPVPVVVKPVKDIEVGFNTGHVITRLPPDILEMIVVLLIDPADGQYEINVSNFMMTCTLFFDAAIAHTRGLYPTICEKMQCDVMLRLIRLHKIFPSFNDIVIYGVQWEYLRIKHCYYQKTIFKDWCDTQLCNTLCLSKPHFQISLMEELIIPISTMAYSVKSDIVKYYLNDCRTGLVEHTDFALVPDIKKLNIVDINEEFKEQLSTIKPNTNRLIIAIDLLAINVRPSLIWWQLIDILKDSIYKDTETYLAYLKNDKVTTIQIQRLGLLYHAFNTCNYTLVRTLNQMGIMYDPTLTTDAISFTKKKMAEPNTRRFLKYVIETYELSRVSFKLQIPA